MTENFANMYINIWSPGGCLSLPGAIYMYITIIFKHYLLQNILANQIQIACEASIICKGDNCLFEVPWSHGFMTKMAATPIYGKKSFKISHEPQGLRP